MTDLHAIQRQLVERIESAPVGWAIGVEAREAEKGKAV